MLYLVVHCCGSELAPSSHLSIKFLYLSLTFGLSQSECHALVIVLIPLLVASFALVGFYCDAQLAPIGEVGVG